MSTRGERGAKIAGILVAAFSLGVVVYTSLKPVLIGEDPWVIAAITAGIVAALAAAVVISIRLHRRSLSKAIRRK